MSQRQRGVTGQVMPASVTGPVDSYALFVRPDGRMLMVHREGVGYEVSDEKPWRFNDFDPSAPTFTPEDLLEVSLHSGVVVDLADWVRTFGARLESNFAQCHAWLTGVRS